MRTLLLRLGHLQDLPPRYITAEVASFRLVGVGWRGGRRMGAWHLVIFFSLCAAAMLWHAPCTHMGRQAYATARSVAILLIVGTPPHLQHSLPVTSCLHLTGVRNHPERWHALPSSRRGTKCHERRCSTTSNARHSLKHTYSRLSQGAHTTLSSRPSTITACAAATVTAGASAYSCGVACASCNRHGPPRAPNEHPRFL